MSIILETQWQWKNLSSSRTTLRNHMSIILQTQFMTDNIVSCDDPDDVKKNN